MQNESLLDNIFFASNKVDHSKYLTSRMGKHANTEHIVDQVIVAYDALTEITEEVSK